MIVYTLQRILAQLVLRPSPNHRRIAEINRLEQIIEDAPHSDTCSAVMDNGRGFVDKPELCDCWKAEWKR